MRIRYNHLLDNSPRVYDVRGNYLRVPRRVGRVLSKRRGSGSVGDSSLDIAVSFGDLARVDDKEHEKQ